MHEMHSTGRNLGGERRERGKEAGRLFLSLSHTSLIPAVWMDRRRNEWRRRRRRKISSCGGCKKEQGEKANKPLFVCEGGGERRRRADKERRSKLDPGLSLTAFCLFR